jgi:2-epi-5-epi-valiolone synthase
VAGTHALRWLSSGGYEVVFSTALLTASPQATESSVLHQQARQSLLDRLRGRRVLLVSTPTVWALHGGERVWALARAASAELDVVIEKLDEAGKSVETVVRICRRADEHRLGRRDLLVAFGGGVCCDLVSVSAALYRRGIDYLCLPTTLVGQIDAGIGIKGAVNLDGHKSRLGSFHPPVAVYADPGWLATVSADAVRSGLAEIVKVAIMRDEQLFELLERVGGSLAATAFQAPAAEATEVLERATDGMLAELQLDPFERHGYQRRMDFGHTYSAWVEEASGFRLTHGQAVAVDMALFSEIAARIGLLERAQADRVLALLDDLGLPLTTRWCRVDGVPLAMVAATAHRGGALELPMPTDIGSATFLPDASAIAPEVVQAALTSLQTRGVKVA